MEGEVHETVHPLSLERFGDHGWFFLRCEAVDGLNLFGPDLDDLFDSAEIAIAELLKKRGQNVIRVTIDAVPEAVEAATPWARPTRHVAHAIHGEMAA